ncbi:DUF4037 domain-containing protein [Paenibacillus herberti]|uniref:DUF4037 domain-containing protein n=1 Tax=Paenibacillus herberti TaxID=1619309 RepID=A0A229P1H5_9BACL|nr:DUF4037 domain-containing protein [Paenibacillus herberti]OXM15901.1 hypothetical protein CGZ75_04095 [Paenibacillus herberti]
MKGLHLCKQFFFEVGLPKIQQELPEIMPYLAAGLGGGSECHENDDEISRDHCWGPGFGVWLRKDYKEQFESELRAVLDRIPKQFMGYGWADEEEAKYACLILNIDDFIKVKVGVFEAPSNEVDWLNIAEERLFEITHCHIFYDATGETTRRFTSFKQYYTEDVWKKRLSHHIHELWRWNVQYVNRAAKRGDFVTAGVLWGRFAEHVMKVGFLLNREYAPYEKWLYVQFRKLPHLGQELGDLISRGIYQIKDIVYITEQIEAVLINELRKIGFEPNDMPEAAYPKETIKLLEFSKGINASIKNLEIRNFSLT